LPKDWGEGGFKGSKRCVCINRRIVLDVAFLGNVERVEGRTRWVCRKSVSNVIWDGKIGFIRRLQIFLAREHRLSDISLCTQSRCVVVLLLEISSSHDDTT
jgi:hypothetical protein